METVRRQQQETRWTAGERPWTEWATRGDGGSDVWRMRVGTGGTRRAPKGRRRRSFSLGRSPGSARLPVSKGFIQAHAVRMDDLD